MSSTCRDVDRLYSRLARIAEEEFPDIVEQAETRKDRLRLHIIDGSFIDIWFSRRILCKYAFHWERRHIDNTVYRWDNAAHRRLERLETFPHHFHEGGQHNIRPFKPRENMGDTLRTILEYIRQRIKKSLNN